MLRRLTLGFAGVMAAAIAIAACSSKDATTTVLVGPSFAPQTLYAANVTQNAINIYAPGAKATAGPVYEIGGGSTTLAGPQYLAFDSGSNLWVTNWLSSTNSGAMLEFKAQATGDVLPYQTYSFGSARPRGIADAVLGSSSFATDVLAVGVVDPAEPVSDSSGIFLFQAASASAPYEYIAGPATGLNVPSGLAFDGKGNLFVSNLQGASVEEFPIGSPSPTPSPTATVSPTASPSASASPTVAPTATPDALAPVATISGASTKLGQPTGLGLDASGNIYVVDQSSSACTPACPAVLVFPVGSNGNVAPTVIAGSNTTLASPTDVKVDKSGNIYVADEHAGAGVVLVFAPGASGNAAPSAVLSSPGNLIGLALTP